MPGTIIIRTTCACGHQAELTSETLGEDAMTFMDFHRLRCSACGRRGRPESVIKAWVSDEPVALYRGYGAPSASDK